MARPDGATLPLHPALSPLIEQIRVQHGGPETYTVLPGPFPVMGFQIQGALEVVRDGATHRLTRSGITGLQPTARQFHAQPQTHSVLVVLKPWAGPMLLDAPMDRIADAHVGLDALVPANDLRRVEDDPSPVTVQQFLLSRLRRARRNVHPAVAWAAQRLLRPVEGITTEKLAGRLGMSRRQLERLFRSHVGVGPKEFASLVRFQRAVSRMHTRRSWADLAYAAGYADQAHLVRDFTRRAGASPARYAAGLGV